MLLQEPTLRQVTLDNVTLAYFERGRPVPGQPTLYFVHATGFHARVWDYIAEAFPDAHIIALEQRGHGRSDPLPVQNWSTFGEDQAAFVDALQLTNLIGVGHSMGAHGLIQGAAMSGRFASLLLLDPTVAAPTDYSEQYRAMFGDQLHPAAKRRANFDSVEQMYSQLREKSSFPHFLPRILQDYCQHGLIPDKQGGLTLACRPTVEAHVYMSARSHAAIYDYVSELQIPVTIVRAKLPDPDFPHDFSSSPTWPGLAGQFVNATDLHWPESTHFIPMQFPDRVIELLAQQIQAWHDTH